MKTIGLKDIDLDEIGQTIHLTGTIWQDKVTQKTYLLPLSDDIEPEMEDLSLLLIDEHETLKLLNQAWLLEARRNSGFKGHLTKCTLVRMRKQIEPRLMWQVFRRDNFTCCYCGEDEGPMTYDHYIPESQGGPTTIENGRTACRNCNSSKGDLLPEEWLLSKQLQRRIDWIEKRKLRKVKKHENNSKG